MKGFKISWPMSLGVLSSMKTSEESEWGKKKRANVFNENHIIPNGRNNPIQTALIFLPHIQ